jgi:hypothetical protein
VSAEVSERGRNPEDVHCRFPAGHWITRETNLSIRKNIGRGLIAATAAVVATVGAAGVAYAATPTIEVQAGRLVLEPGARGYHGSLPVVVTYHGDQPDYAGITIVEPVAGAFTGLRPEDACGFNSREDGRREIGCGVPGGDLQPGERRRFVIDFDVLTTTRDYAMSAAATSLEVSLGNGAGVADATSATLFRSTSGSLRNPQPYVQDTKSDISVTAQNTTLALQADGSYAGRVPVTVRYAGDAPHFELGADIALPAGVESNGVDPSEACGTTWCPVPGGTFAAGETRTFDLLVSAPATAATGPAGSGAITVTASWYSTIEDVDASDNTATFALTIG